MLQATTTPAQLQSFFHDNGITLLYWGPQERQDRRFDPSQEPFLGLVYEAGGVRLYRVIGGTQGWP
jgi:hypothetical protein